MTLVDWVVVGWQELGASFNVGDIPADLMDQAAEWREKLMEQVVEMDDDVMEKYLDVSSLTCSSSMILLQSCLCCPAFSTAPCFWSGPFLLLSHLDYCTSHPFKDNSCEVSCLSEMAPSC